MANIDYSTFRTYLFKWAETNKERFKLFWPLKGGWEQWVQAEVAAYILKQNSAYDILREENIYEGSQLRADWVLNRGIDESATIAVELKCQRGSDLEGKEFLIGIESDINKLQNLLPGSIGKGVVGIYYSQQAINKIKQQYPGHLHEGNHQIYGGEIGIFMLD